MQPLKVTELEPGQYSLTLVAGSTAVDDTIAELGHEPNGEFWAGVAELLIETQAPALADRFEWDPEGGMFCAYATDRDALEQLGTLMAAVANDTEALTKLVELAEERGFEFDD